MSLMASLKERFVEMAPDWLFALAYDWFYKRNRGMTITGKGKDWQIVGDGIDILSPTPQMVLMGSLGLQRFANKFERYFTIKLGDTVLDVGACVGDTTVPMAIKTGPAGRTIAIEPHPVNVGYLRRNLVRFPNTQVIDKAVWNKKDTVTFHVHDTPTGHSIQAHKERKGRMEVVADTLDNLLGDIIVDFAKIDVQYTEVEALQGADRFLKNVKKLIVETHSRTDPQLRTYPAVLEILKGYGFNLRFAMDNGCVYAWRNGYGITPSLELEGQSITADVKDMLKMGMAQADIKSHYWGCKPFVDASTCNGLTETRLDCLIWETYFWMTMNKEIPHEVH